MRAKLPLIIAALSAVLVGFGSWFYQSTRLQDYARGIIAPPTNLLTSDNSRTNIALLGVGGHGHEGGELTDSILVASLHHETKKITLISIPRDIWLSSQVAKINSIYYYAEKQSPDTGLTKVKNALIEVTGLPIHYSLLIDFSGFIKAIDAVGGIEVTVDRTFDDYKYPIPGKENVEPEADRYEHLHFEAGAQRMDGVTALKYVRSRHALGEEGTDFARSIRQQKVIRAFLRSLISTQTVFNSERITTLESALSSSIKTDIPESLYASFTKFGLTLNFDEIKSITIESLLYNPKNLKPYGSQWVLLPIKDWTTIHSYVQENLN